VDANHGEDNWRWEEILAILMVFNPSTNPVLEFKFQREVLGVESIRRHKRNAFAAPVRLNSKSPAAERNAGNIRLTKGNYQSCQLVP